MNIDKLLEKNLLPDSLTRFGIRRLLKKRLEGCDKGSAEGNRIDLMNLISALKVSPLAVNTREANEQHYEVPTEFYKYALGPNLKYSCGYWEWGVKDFADSESKMLELTCQRAGIKNGEEILELGCGWGSLTLYMASKFPESKITAVSNSRTQKEFIDSQAAKRGLANITIITSDMNDFNTDRKFDRIVSVEMFEHMRNYEILFNRIYGWLKPEGELFVHIFTHKQFAYLFEVKDDSDWMSKYFFTGGIMPSDHLLFYFSGSFDIKGHWIVNGKNYEKTSNAWLKNMDDNRAEILKLFAAAYGEENKVKWFSYWRIFFMACAELWGYKDGEEWFVSHYLFRKR